MTPKFTGQLKIFDDYAFKGQKGTGAFGTVREVEHKRTGLKRACKALMIKNPRHFELVETEVSLMRRLDHPNVLRLFESYYDGDRNIYLIIELCVGGTLDDTMKAAKPGLMAEAHAAWGSRDMLAALQYCHHQGVVHRDIKPDNLLYLRKGVDSPLKVIDFGLSDFRTRIERKSMPQGRSEKPAHRIGTPHYMAPEIYTEGLYDDKVDVFACGVCLAEMLTGAHPFFELGVDNLESIRGKILHKGNVVDLNAERWAKVSQRARDFCRSLLEPDRSKRFDAAEALAHPFLRGVRQSTASGAGSSGDVRRAVFEALARFRTHHVLQQAALRVLAKQLDDSQVAVLERQFQLIDADGSGRLSGEELLAGAKACGVDIDEDECRDILRVFARQAGGGRFESSAGEEAEVEYSDFLAAMAERDVSPTEPQLRDIFERFCSPGDEEITVQSLRSALGSISQRPPPLDGAPQSMAGEDVSEHELREVFEEMGAGGRIDFRTFCEMWASPEATSH